MLGRRGKDARVAVLRPPHPSSTGRFLALAVVLAVAVLGASGKLADLLPSFSNPFGTKTVDRSDPPLLDSLVNLSSYQAASANFQVIVDREKDSKLLPSIVRGERTVFVADGSVDAAVDFSGLDERSVSVSEDRRSATLVLPAPVLSEAHVDPAHSRVVSRDRGILDRIGSVFSDTPTGEQDLYVAAARKMQAAAAQSDLRARAEQNTRGMLEGMMRSLGFTNVSVTFAADPT